MTCITAEDINKKSYYRVTQENELSVVFCTDSGITYSVGITKDPFIFEDNSYYLYIVPNKQPKGYDSNVLNTISAIVENIFYNSEESILLYICDITDAKQAARSRLFKQWFNKYPQKEEYLLEIYHSVDNGIDYFYGLITKRNNPYLNDILSTFRDFLSNY